MTCYDETKPLHLETDVSGVGLVASCREEMAQAAQETRHLTTTYYNPY